MFRRLVVVLGVLALGITGYCQPVESSKPLIWGADLEGGAPYITTGPDGKLIGFEVEIAAALAKELGRPIEFKQVAFDSLLPHLERGDIHLAMNGLEVTPDRKSRVRFTRPYYIYRQQLVVRADDNRFPDYRAVKAAKGVTVGTLDETAAMRLLQRDDVPVKPYPDSVSPYRDLELKRIDAVLQDYPIALYLVKKQEDFKDKLKLVGPPVEPGEYAIALSIKDQALAQQVDAALARIIQDGTLRKILEKWELWNDDQDLLSVHGGIGLEEAGTDAWPFRRYFPLLVEGAGLTVLLTVLSMILAVCLGLVIALMRLYGPAPLRWLAIGYVEFFRGIPVLLLLFYLYFGLLPQITGQLEVVGLRWPPRLDPFVAAIVGFGLNYAAYEAEIYRAGISAIPAGQWEAAASLGMPGALTFRRIILPQAIRTILPPMTNDFIALFKDTSVVSIIAINELTKQYQIVSKASLKYEEVGLVTAALYLILSIPLGYLSRYLEERWVKHL